MLVGVTTVSPSLLHMTEVGGKEEEGQVRVNMMMSSVDVELKVISGPSVGKAAKRAKKNCVYFSQHIIGPQHNSTLINHINPLILHAVKLQCLTVSLVTLCAVYAHIKQLLYLILVRDPAGVDPFVLAQYRRTTEQVHSANTEQPVEWVSVRLDAHPSPIRISPLPHVLVDVQRCGARYARCVADISRSKQGEVLQALA